MGDDPVRREDLARAAACVVAHPHAAELGAFAYDVLTTQAEGRSLFAGQKFMSQRAAEHGVERDNAATDLGNLLLILERGPSGRGELALLAAFALHGFARVFSAASALEQPELARKLVAHIDWLHAATAYRLWPLDERLVPEPVRHALYDAVAAALLRDDAADGDIDVATRARNAARLGMLAAESDAHARGWLTRLRSEAKDPITRASAAAYLGELPPDPAQTALSVFGLAAPVARKPVIAVLRWVSGWALLDFAYQVVCFLLRVRREVELELQGPLLRVRGRTAILGRTVRHWQAAYAVERVSGALRRARFALLRTIVGALALCVGVLLGGHLAFEGSRGGASLLLPLSALVTALGAGLDLALYVLGDALHGRVQLQLDLAGARSLRLSGVPLADADRFLAALAARLGTRPATRLAARP